MEINIICTANQQYLQEVFWGNSTGFVVSLIGMVSLEFSPPPVCHCEPRLVGRGNLIAEPVPKRKRGCNVAFICLYVLEWYQARTRAYGGMLMAITKEWFTVEEAAEYLCVSRRTIYKLTKEGRLPAFRIGKERHRRFRKEDIDKVPRPGEEATNLEALLRLSAKADPVLAEVWDNEKDAAYDRL
jgi:excisionase family DNA binding protein